MAKIIISGLTKTDKQKIFTDLLMTSRKRYLTKFENFLFTLLYADRRKCETELTISGNLLEIIHADYSKSLAINQRFFIDDLLGETIRFDKDGKPKENHNTMMY